MAKTATTKRQPPDAAKRSTAATSRLLPVPDEVRARIVQLIDEGLGLGTVARKLNDDRVEKPGKAKEWTPQSIRSVYVRATGLPGIKAAREQAPLKRGRDEPDEAAATE
jgi:hypothetical protein